MMDERPWVFWGPADGTFPLAMAGRPLKNFPMTRSSIEMATKIYIVALSIVFLWSVTKVLAQMGYW